MSIVLEGDEILLGRDPDCDIVIEEDWVSRRHCRLLRWGDQWLIEDLCSTNGVTVNGEAAQGRVPLASRDRIGIGDFEFALVGGSGDASGAPATLPAAAPPSSLDGPGSGAAAPTALRSAEPCLHIGMERVLIARPAELCFDVALTIRMETEREVTDGGKMPLAKLARRGTLAADVRFGGRFRGRFGRRRFLLMDRYGLTGRVGCTLRLGLMLPKRTGDGRRETVEVDVQYRVDHAIVVPKLTGPGVVNRNDGGISLTDETRMASVAEGSGDAEATRRLLHPAAFTGRAAPYEVGYASLVAILGGVCESCCGDVEPARGYTALETMRDRVCREAAGLYRDWYGERWGHKAVSHDSQLTAGEIRYRFDARGKMVGRAQAVVAHSLYRWM
ncbi:MAG: FHA domain-containing protein [Lentisphaeria bacterium]|nr:FHA domain-containing protein [Lentisphaeria bacterium]